MSETIIDALDRVIPSIVSPKETLRLRANSLCASCGDSLYQQLLIPDYALSWALLDRHLFSPDDLIPKHDGGEN
jgi:hypothetical protein